MQKNVLGGHNSAKSKGRETGSSRAGVIRFCRSLAELLPLAQRMKLEPCPYCHIAGCLFLHDWLYGYTEYSMFRQKKGKRIYCSDKARPKGCGRTFAILLADCMRRVRMAAQSFWEYLSNVAEGQDRRNAFRMASIHFSNSTIYRLWNRFKKRQSFLRTLLWGKLSKPPSVATRNPSVETIRHLQAAFPKASCPVRAFQLHFQVSFL